MERSVDRVLWEMAVLATIPCALAVFHRIPAREEHLQVRIVNVGADYAAAQAWMMR